MEKKAGAYVNMKECLMIDSVAGANKVYKGSVHYEGNISRGDIISGKGAVSVGGNARDITTNSTVERRPTHSEMKSDSDDEKTTSSKTGNSSSGDIVSGKGAVKVGRNARDITTNSTVLQHKDQNSAHSGTKSDSDDEQSISSKTGNFGTGDIISGKGAVKVGRNARDITTNSTVFTAASSTRGTDYDVSKILDGEDEEIIQDVRDKLHNLGVNKSKDFGYVTESDLIDGGIKKVQARKLLGYFANHQSQQSASGTNVANQN